MPLLKTASSKVRDLLHHFSEPIYEDDVHSLVGQCTKSKNLKAGRQLYCSLISNGLDSDAELNDYLIRMFAACGSLEESNLIFNKFSKPTLYTWHAIVSAHALLGESQKAIQLFYRLQEEGLRPTKFIYLSVLRATGQIKCLIEGRLTHYLILKHGLECDVVVGSTIIDMYGKCGSINEAKRVFDLLPGANVVSWNAMIAGYVQQKEYSKALELFMKMKRVGIKPTKFTFSCVLKGCNILEQCREIHEQVIVCDLECDVVVGTSLVDVYGKCGDLEQAQRIFDKMKHPDTACWNSIISRYAQFGHGFPALELFEKMYENKIRPDNMTFSSVLKACGCVGAIEVGRFVYNEIMVKKLESDLILGNALIDMYAKCGKLKEAHKVLIVWSVRDLVSWNIMISYYAQHGNCYMVRECLREMIKEDFKPDERTFLSILAACSHAGDVNEGHAYFISMVEDFGVMQSEEHLNCMIDMLGRAGHLKEAEVFLGSLPMISSSLNGWTSLLSACSKYNNTEVAKQSFEKASTLDPGCGSGYVLFSTVCAGVAS